MQPTDQSGDPAWALRDGTVYLSGSAYQPSGVSSELAILPKAASPAHEVFLNVYTYGGTYGQLSILPGRRD